MKDLQEVLREAGEAGVTLAEAVERTGRDSLEVSLELKDRRELGVIHHFAGADGLSRYRVLQMRGGRRAARSAHKARHGMARDRR